jgi:hypothetical protein
VSSPPYKLHVGIPTFGMARMEFSVDSVGEMMYVVGRNHPEIESVVIHRDVRTYRQEARQALVKEAQKGGATHLLMLDDDHQFRGTDFTKLWSAMIGDERIKMLAGLYFTRGIPTAPCIFRNTTQGTVPIFFYPEDQVVAVDVVGFGFTLFDMECFKAVNPPWFNLGHGFGEDAAFCARMKMCGLSVHVHTGCKIGHIHEQPQIIDEAMYLRDRDQWYGNQQGSPELVPAEFIGQVNPGIQPSVRKPVWRPATERIRSFLSGAKAGTETGSTPDTDGSCVPEEAAHEAAGT